MAVQGDERDTRASEEVADAAVHATAASGPSERSADPVGSSQRAESAGASQPDAPADDSHTGVLATIVAKLPFGTASSKESEAHDTEPQHGDDDASPSSTAKPGSFLTYAQTALDPFTKRPLCELDSLVFSWLAYYRLSAPLRHARTREGIALHELLRAEDFESMFGTSWDPEGSRELLFAVCASPRFRDARLTCFAFKTDEASAEQFAAMTFTLPGGGAYIAFRGTDSTLVGWREDFDMASRCPVPSQREARAYVEHVASYVEGPLYLGGHSKGGNLAVYAAATVPASVQDRIVRVFSHDGPGFDRALVEGDGYTRIRDRVDKTVPKSSIIGLIMDTERDFTVVESGGISVLQHNPFLWEADGCEFRRADGLSASSRYFGATVADWMDRFTPEERGAFIATLFDVLGVTGAQRFADIRDSWRTSLPAMRDAAESLAPEQRAFVMDVLKALVRVATIDRVLDASSSLVESLLPSHEEEDDATA